MNDKDIFFSQVKKRKPFLWFYSLLTALLIGLKFTQLHSFFSDISYAMLFIAVVVALFLYSKGSCRSLSFIALSFLLAGALSLMFNPIITEFRPVERYALFALMFVGTGPLLHSNKMEEFRLLVFRYLQIIVVVISIVSFFTYIFHLPFAFGHSGFKGVTPHSMDLSPVSALASLSLLYMIFIVANKKRRSWLIVALLISIVTLFLSASRGAILGFFMSVIFFFYYRDRKIGKLISSCIAIGIVITTLVVINPFSMMDGLEAKMERVEMDNDITGGREGSLGKRFREFNENPLFGIGFSSMKYSHTTVGGYFEPGSGWVFILSSTGLVGLVLALMLCFNAVRNSIAIRGSALIASVCVFFMIHSLIEGYILTVSNGLCLFMWLVVGLANNKKLLSTYV